jgi:hypothetical protein
MPVVVIGDLREPEPSTVLAGVFYGWLNSDRAYLGDVPEGPGRLLITTCFQGYGHDPFCHRVVGSNTADGGGCARQDLDPVINRGARWGERSQKIDHGFFRPRSHTIFRAG